MGLDVSPWSRWYIQDWGKIQYRKMPAATWTLLSPLITWKELLPPGPINFVHDQMYPGMVCTLLTWQSKFHWAHLGQHRQRLGAGRKNLEHLMDHINREKEILRSSHPLTSKLVQSMPQRLHEVIEKKGGWTRSSIYICIPGLHLP